MAMERFAQNVKLPQKGFFGWLTSKLFERENGFLELNAVKLCDLKPNHQILELGFGPGVGLEAAYKQIKDGSGKVWGLDLSPYMHEVASNRLKTAIDSGNVELCLGSVMEIPFEDNTFDRVFHCNCFYFWPDFNKSVQEIYRVMKPESLMVTTINQASVEKAVERGVLKYGNPDVPLYMEILSKNGFSNVHLKEFDERGKVYQVIFASVGKKENE